MKYNLEVRKAKSNAICRECKKKINSGQIIVKVAMDDGYRVTSMMVHSDCLLVKIIKDIIKIQEDDLKSQIQKFKDVEKLLK